MKEALFIFMVLAPCIAAFAAEPSQVEVPNGTEDILREMESSNDKARVEALGQALSSRGATTESEAKHLLQDMKNPSIAPFAQMAISKTTAPALGAALHESLKDMKGQLRHMTPEQLKTPSPEWKAEEDQALNTAAVIHALGAMKYEPAAADFRELLNYDDALNGAVAWEASQALAAMGDEQGFSMMMNKMGQGKALAISGYGARGINGILEKIDSIDTTTKTKPLGFGDPRHAQITRLANDLGNIRSNDPAVKDALRKLLYHKYKRIQWEASEALSENLQPTDAAISLEMLRHKEAFVRQNGLNSLCVSRTWDKSFLPIVLDMLQHDPDEMARSKAAEVLMSLPPRIPREDLFQATPYLEAALKDESTAVRYQAFEALRVVTGKFYPYEGMTEVQKRRMEREPANRYK